MRANHELAALRRRGKGVWIIEFCVLGYDDDFIMYAPGQWKEQVAIVKTGVALANKLRVHYPGHIIFKAAKLETP